MTSGDGDDGLVEGDERDSPRTPEESEDRQLKEQEIMGDDTAVHINPTVTEDTLAIVDTPITKDALIITTDMSSTTTTAVDLGEIAQVQPAIAGLEGSCIKSAMEASSAATTIHTQPPPRLKMPVYRDAPFCAQNPSSTAIEKENASPEFQLTTIDFDQARLVTQKENQKME
jgi:hypothetical protein